MFWIQLSLARIKAICCVTLTLIFFLSYPYQALAQSKGFWENLWEQVSSIGKKRTKLEAPRGRTKALAGRGRCPALIPIDIYELPLTAFVPALSNLETKEQSSQKISSYQNVWSTTAAEYPTFWFYIPYSYNDSGVKYAKFALLDRDNHLVFDPILLEFPKNEKNNVDKPSIAQFTLPNEIKKGLEIGKEYKWYFSIICDARKPSKNPSVSGWIQRVKSPFPVEPSKDVLTQNGSQYYIKTYAKAGIWHETLTLAANNKEQQIEFPQENWVSLIQYIFQDEIQNTKKKTLEEQSTNYHQIANKIANSPMIKLAPAQNQEELENELW
jgi:Domain of Unknown Function (DUF928)